MKYLGILVAIVGAIILMLTWVVSSMGTNSFLIWGIILVVGGFLAHIVINKLNKTNK